MRDAIEKGEKIDNEWANEPIAVPRLYSYNAMVEYLDGADIIRKWIERMVYWGENRVDMHSVLYDEVWNLSRYLKPLSSEKK